MRINRLYKIWCQNKSCANASHWRSSCQLRCRSPVTVTSASSFPNLPTAAIVVYDRRARAPTKRTSGMTRVSKSCTLVVEPYCFNLYSGSVEDRQRNGRKGSVEKRTEGPTAVRSILDSPPPLDSHGHPSIGQ